VAEANHPLADAGGSERADRADAVFMRAGAAARHVRLFRTGDWKVSSKEIGK